MGRPKADLPVAGKPLVQWAVETACSVTEHVVVVLGPDRPVPEALSGNALVTCLSNPEPQRGLASSVAIGVEHGLRAVAHGTWIFVTLGDLPLILRRTYRLLWNARVPGHVVFPRYRDATPADRFDRGHPVLLPREAAEHLLAQRDAISTMRQLTQQFPEVVVDVADPGIRADVDRPQDIADAVARLNALQAPSD